MITISPFLANYWYTHHLLLAFHSLTSKYHIQCSSTVIGNLSFCDSRYISNMSHSHELNFWVLLVLRRFLGFRSGQ